MKSKPAPKSRRQKTARGGTSTVKREMRLPAKIAVKTIDEVLEDLAVGYPLGLSARESELRYRRLHDLLQRRFEVGMVEAENYLHERALEYFRLKAEREAEDQKSRAGVASAEARLAKTRKKIEAAVAELIKAKVTRRVWVSEIAKRKILLDHDAIRAHLAALGYPPEK